MRGCWLGRDSTRVESQMCKKEAGARGEGTKADEQRDSFRLQRQLGLKKATTGFKVKIAIIHCYYLTLLLEVDTWYQDLGARRRGNQTWHLAMVTLGKQSGSDKDYRR